MLESASPTAAAQEFDADGLPILRHLHLNPAWLALRHEDALEPEGGYFLDELLADLRTGHKVVATVFSQCGYAYRTTGPQELRPVGETEFVAGVARQAEQRGEKTRVCAGIVGHADMELGDAAGAVLDAHIEAGGGRFRGIRHITARHDAFNGSLLGRPPADLLQRPNFRRGLQQLQARGLSFDAWLYHTQIDQVVDLAHAMPELPIVLNHVGGPLGVFPYRGRRETAFPEWKASIARLAACPNVCLKLGGLAMALCGFDFHLQPQPPSSEQLASEWRPYLQTSIELLGARRCMFESNFPVDKAMCSYAVLWNGFKRVAAGASADEKAWLFKGTADAFYRLGL